MHRNLRHVFAVVPAYNEAVVIGDVLASLVARGVRVVVVDDGSADETAAVARRHPVTVVRHPINLGQGASLQTGTTLALRLGAAYIVHYDADGQHQVSDIDRLLAPLRGGEADVALGSRFLRKLDRRLVPFMRRVVLLGGVFVNGLATGLWLTDAHNGFRAMTRDAAEKIRIRENGFAHASEILAEIRRHALRHVEVPTTITYSRRSLEKGQSGWNAINILIDIISGRFLR